MCRYLLYYHLPYYILFEKKMNILTNTKFEHVTSTYYHSQYLVFEFAFKLLTFIGLLILSVCVRI
jgi:hypothetical protein